ncbi:MULTISPECIES: urea ABC transporter permease subunit UrtC [unclassified Streptomyces]|uniref:urea ABC transporter permease subunit UrtC n=1 Tax=unclassified Streptomyces TaxID=2593676 RepID=UPI0013698C04|nr:urea ABC transporter permease subunit UrtC [Streptomyces sp. YIM 132580]MXG26943.1 urea ABC transporter permease subunit UrtC [Streptomyces sp. YIM 132580]
MTTTSTPPTTAPAAGAPAGPPDRPFLTRFRTPAAFLLGAVLLVGVAPLVLSDFRLGLLAKYLCYGIVAVGVSLAWGRGGLLVLGQGVFFGLGGYAMAMHLKLADAAATGETLPDFMLLYGTEGGLPWWWQPFAHPAFALAMTVLLPMAVAALLGVLVFRRRVKGAYFAILSQALAAALAIWLVGQQATTGGTNGLTDFQGFLGYDLNDPVNQRMVYVIIAVALLLLMAGARQLFVSRYGELLIAVRDSEERVRFLGYNPADVKLVAYVVAAGMAGLAGALFVPAVGIISPALIGVVPSIGFVIGAAVGGRASLVGAVLGAIAVAWAQSTLSDAWPAGWTYLQGLLFVVAVGFLPGGLASLRTVLRRRRTADRVTTTKGVTT